MVSFLHVFTANKCSQWLCKWHHCPISYVAEHTVAMQGKLKQTVETGDKWESERERPILPVVDRFYKCDIGQKCAANYAACMLPQRGNTKNPPPPNHQWICAAATDLTVTVGMGTVIFFPMVLEWPLFRTWHWVGPVIKLGSRMDPKLVSFTCMDIIETETVLLLGLPIHWPLPRICSTFKWTDTVCFRLVLNLVLQHRKANLSTKQEWRHWYH